MNPTLREALRGYLNEHDSDYDGPRCKCTLCIQGRAALDRPDDGWISVEDRLPEEGKQSLLFGDYTAPVGGPFYVGFMEASGIFCSDDELSQIRNVTHWQPLPAPPQSREDQP